MKKMELLCPICQAQTELLDVVDFNKNCEEGNGFFLPLSGVPIYYSQCTACFFTFAPEFAIWTESEFLKRIYNDEYIEVDPDYLDVRPKLNSSTLIEVLGENKKNIKHLDYGGGSGKLSSLLRGDGWNSESYDPFSADGRSLKNLGRYDLITAYEVFEHVPDVNLLMKNLVSLMDESCLILFSTLILDGSIQKNGRLAWWYASPRNGHISLFSKKSLVMLAIKYQLNFGSFGDNFHFFYKRLPTWSNHLIKET